MKKIRIVTIVAMALLLVAGQAAAAEFKATMKMGSTQPTDHPYMVGAQKFADLIKQRTIGLIVINLYPSFQLGINPVHMGIIVCFNLVLGLITPPVGGVLFAVCGVSGLSLEKLSVAVWKPFWIALAVLLLITYIPRLSTFLPGLFMPGIR